MKVLHDATNDWEAKVECEECKSVMEIDQGDLMIGEFGGSYCERGEPHTYVRCPCCKNCILVDTPGWLFRRVQEKGNAKE